MKYTWERKHSNGYEVSTRGDKRFSAFNAWMPDGRSIEQWYQCDVKGHDIGGTNWKKGKGKPSLIDYPDDGQWEMYLALWKFWTIRNLPTVKDLQDSLQGRTVFTDTFASTPINQARALAWIFNNWIET